MSERSTGPRLVRRPPLLSTAPKLDAAQRSVTGHTGGPLLVLAGPGTGKTTTLVETVAARISSGTPAESVLVLTFSRRAAAELRHRVAARLSQPTVEPLARTFHSYAFGVLRREAAASGAPAPRLLSAAEQDRVVRDLLAGDLATGAPTWPRSLHPALRTAGFAQELRDLLLRCAERGLDDRSVAELAARGGRADWAAVARFARQYSEVTTLGFAGAYDPAELVHAVIELWRAEPALLRREQEARSLVLVDELQDADPAQLHLLELLAGGGRDLIAVGDPDQAIYGFRGADVGGIRDFPDRFRDPGGAPAPVVALQVSRRAGPELLEATRRVAARLGGACAHRRLAAAPGTAAGRAEVHVLRSSAQEAAYAAARLREAHLVAGVPWARMAVLVRSAPTAMLMLRRALSAAGVPVADLATDVLALSEQPAVADLLALCRCALQPEALDEPTAETLLLSAWGGADALLLRRLRLDLTRVAALSGASSSSPLADALRAPADLGLVNARLRGPVQRVAGLLTQASEQVAAGASAEELLWTVWSASGLSERWTRRSAGGGRAGAAADRDLDAMLALFEAAGRFSDRLPGAGAAVFLDEVEGRALSEAGRQPRGASRPGVALLTAHAGKGLEWDVVVVVGVQEGRWPDTRRRGTVLGRDELLRTAAGGGEQIDPAVTAAMERAAVLEEERRLFYVATTRARALLVVTAVLSEAEELSPSPFLDELCPYESAGERPFSDVPRPLELSALVADLRSTLLDPASDSERRAAGAAALARLAEAGVPGADPDDWYGISPLSDDGSLAGPEDEVTVSPSRVDTFLRCQLRWFLEQSGAGDSEGGAAGLGTIVHAVAAAAALPGGADEATLRRHLDALLQGADLGRGWCARRARERASAMVALLTRWLAGQRREVVGAELPFDVSVGRARLRGRVDRLERDAEGRGVVVDFKTGSTPVAKDELQQHSQLAVYQLAVRSGAFSDVLGSHEPGGAELVQLGKAALTGSARVQRQFPLADAEDPGWPERTLIAVADGMAGSAFQAVENSLCRSCPVSSSCPVQPEGRRVSA